MFRKLWRCPMSRRLLHTAGRRVIAAGAVLAAGVTVAACGTTGPSQGTGTSGQGAAARSEEHTSELQSRRDLVCRLLLEKKKKTTTSLSISKTKNNKLKNK